MAPNGGKSIKTLKNLEVGERHTVTIEKVAHGGHFIARHERNVIFVRHAIPGEVVDIEITSTGSSFVRADAVKVVTASPERVSPPCKFAAPQLCGGCDFQHISLSFQRSLKADVIREQFSRLAKMDIEIEVEEVGGQLKWRTRTISSTDDAGAIGFYASRTHRVVPVDDCVILAQEMKFEELAKRNWPARSRVEISVSGQGERTIAIAPAQRGVKSRITEGPKISHEIIEGHSVEVSQNSFWQSHALAPTVLSQAVIEHVEIGDHVLDLYGGVGLFTAAVLDRIGPKGQVDLIESSRSATQDAQRNFAGMPNIRIHTGDVDVELKKVLGGSLVILDPPREGAGKSVLSQVAELRPRAMVYVACDPAALARDTAYLSDLGYELASLRAFDLFPMTHHVECVARFEPSQKRKNKVS
ncbi:MAG: TRAM domain-containing protein [Actinobacteria bacterium]|nr:TRAM domain-containing protein [Actinomycetota bacterium]